MCSLGGAGYLGSSSCSFSCTCSPGVLRIRTTCSAALSSTPVNPLKRPIIYINQRHPNSRLRYHVPFDVKAMFFNHSLLGWPEWCPMKTCILCFQWALTRSVSCWVVSAVIPGCGESWWFHIVGCVIVNEIGRVCFFYFELGALRHLIFKVCSCSRTLELEKIFKYQMSKICWWYVGPHLPLKLVCRVYAIGLSVHKGVCTSWIKGGVSPPRWRFALFYLLLLLGCKGWPFTSHHNDP